MVNKEIRLIIFFVAEDGEALYSQQKQDRELTVAQLMNSLLPNSDLKKVGKTTRPFSSVQSLSHVYLFATKDGEALYSQQKQDQELTVDHIINSLLPNSD